MATDATTGLRAIIEAATVADPDVPADEAARFVLAAGALAGAADTDARVRTELDPAFAILPPFGPATLDERLLVLPGRRFVSDAAAFEAGHRLAAALGLASVEPEVIAGVMPDESAGGGGDLPLEGFDAFPLGCWTQDDPRVETRRDWALGAMRVREAWAFAEARGRPDRGAGIVIAQPDTGVTAHVELDGIARAGGLNLLEATTPDDPTDPLDGGGQPGHGTGTASVLVSPEGGLVAGVAPRARHLPIRAIRSVVRLSQVKVADAINRAVDMGAHVVTLSLGGIYSAALARAVQRAVAADVILLAAAGNCVRVVVWPARFDDAIAIGGTNLDDATWRGSCRGGAVDVCAPAENVYRAAIGRAAAGQGQGTSYAVALTAGVAACWLAYHGRPRVIAEARARGETVQAMFRRMLKATARRPGTWDAGRYGTGIVDAAALLAAPFEAGRELETPATPVAPPRGTSVRDLALEVVGDAALAPGIDWQRHGGEISLRLLRPGGGLESMSADASPTLAAELPEALRDALKLSAPLAAPAVAARPPDAGKRADPDRIAQQRRILAAGEAARGSGAPDAAAALEGTVAHDAPIPAPDAVLARVDAVMKAMPAGEMSDPAAFRQALDTMYRFATPALRKLAPGSAAPLSHNEGAALEAIIIADGSRPSFLLKDGKPPLTHPFLGTWADQVAAFAPAIQKIARGVGRIQPTGGHASRYIGTGTLIDLDRLLVLTNYHVIDDARTRHGVPMTQQGDILTVHGGLEIDFVGEAASLDAVRFKVVGAALPAGFGRGIGVVDAAVLRIEPIDGAAVPIAAAPRFSRSAILANGGVTSLATIGFPGPPVPSADDAGIDWGFVTRVLFDNKFGFKRLAPGTFWKARGFDPQDRAKLAFGHDASTFGGASGSLVVAWAEDGQPAFGLHFAGFTGKSNYAVSLAAAADALAAIGVPLVE